MVDILELVFGILLVYSIMKIRSEIKSQEKESARQINTKVILQYSVAFGFFIVAVFLQTVFWIGSRMNFNIDSHSFKAYNVSQIFMLIASFISSALLCKIFWDLGTKLPDHKKLLLVS